MTHILFKHLCTMGHSMIIKVTLSCLAVLGDMRTELLSLGNTKDLIILIPSTYKVRCSNLHTDFCPCLTCTDSLEFARVQALLCESMFIQKSGFA